MSSNNISIGRSGVLFMVSKFPIEGKVKTRLQSRLSPNDAYRVALSFNIDILHRIAAIDLPTGWKRVVLFAPASAAAEFEELLQQEQLFNVWSLHPQIGGLQVDLTQKLQAALAFDGLGNGPSVFIGMDTPDISTDIIQKAIDIASSGGSFIQPARDGGYVILSLPSGSPPSVFENIQWSSIETCDDQCAAIEAANIPITRCVQIAVDVDEPADLDDLYMRLLKCHNDGIDICPRTLAVLKDLYRTTS